MKEFNCKTSPTCDGCPQYDVGCAILHGKPVPEWQRELLKCKANEIIEPERWEEDE